MRLNLVVHEEEITAKTPPVERPVPAETHMEGCLCSRYGVREVFGIFVFSYGDVSATDIRRWDGIRRILMVLACLGGLRTEILEE